MPAMTQTKTNSRIRRSKADEKVSPQMKKQKTATGGAKKSKKKKEIPSLKMIADDLITVTQAYAADSVDSIESGYKAAVRGTDHKAFEQDLDKLMNGFQDAIQEAFGGFSDIAEKIENEERDELQKKKEEEEVNGPSEEEIKELTDNLKRLKNYRSKLLEAKMNLTEEVKAAESVSRKLQNLDGVPSSEIEVAMQDSRRYLSLSADLLEAIKQKKASAVDNFE